MTNKSAVSEAVEENGRLEARIQAFAINAQSEQDVLSSEVGRILCYYTPYIIWQISQQYREAVEENGRLEARIQAFAFNAQSEQDVLSSEVGHVLYFVMECPFEAIFHVL